MGNVCTRKINSCKNDFRSWVCCLKITKNVWLPSRPLLVDHHYHKLHQYYTLQKNWSVWWVFFSSNNLHLQSRMWKLRVPQMPSSAIIFRYIATLLYKDLKSSHQAHLKGTCALGETRIDLRRFCSWPKVVGSRMRPRSKVQQKRSMACEEKALAQWENNRRVCLQNACLHMSVRRCTDTTTGLWELTGQFRLTDVLCNTSVAKLWWISLCTIKKTLCGTH